jgi:hypothetical protein
MGPRATDVVLDPLDPDKFDKALIDNKKFKITRPTLTERMHNANFVIFVDHRNGVHVAKNRHSGKTGKVSTKELINILTRILVEHIFDGRMIIFQEAMKWRLKAAIKKIVKDGA